MLAGANALYFTLFDEAWVLKPGDDAPFEAKAVAVSAITWARVRPLSVDCAKLTTGAANADMAITEAIRAFIARTPFFE